jgi:hypothetical protein
VTVGAGQEGHGALGHRPEGAPQQHPVGHRHGAQGAVARVTGDPKDASSAADLCQLHHYYASSSLSYPCFSKMKKLASTSKNQSNHNLKTYLFSLCIPGKNFLGDRLPLIYSHSLSNQIYSFWGEFSVTWPSLVASVVSCLE